MKTYKRKLKLKESIKDKLMITSCIVLVIVGVIIMQKRVEELDEKNIDNNGSIPVAVNSVK